FTIKGLEEKQIVIDEQKRHLVYLQNLIDDRDFRITDLNSSLTSIERSFTWKVLKAWDIFISFIFPKGSFLHNGYRNIINWNQNLLNEWLPGKVVKIIKKKEEEKKEIRLSDFWKKFDDKHEGSVDILFVNHDEKRTGAPRILFDIAEEEMKNRNVAMISMGKGSMGADFEESFGPVIYAEDLYPKLKEYDQIKTIIEKVNPKILYANSISTYKYAEVAKDLGIKVIFHVHELDIAFKIVFNTHKKREKFKKIADKYIAVSQPVYDLLVNKMECPHEKVELINAFVSRDKVLDWSKSIEPDFIKQEIKKEKDDIVIMGLGMFIYRKGADMFMEMADRLKRRGHNCHFVWVGSKPFKEPFMADFSKYKESFLLLGEKSNPFPYLAAADIFVCPSREDPFPLVVLEAMALGKPTVVFKDAGGISEAVKDSGIIVENMEMEDFSSALEEIIINKENRESLAIKAEENQFHYDSSIALPKISNLIDDIM
ncbi:glycosyltransferase, partial [Candidatus Pacebacteria bacterium]|nr:glycosyltransferase [Candidatus Paceibacterota bacterium]